MWQNLTSHCLTFALVLIACNSEKADSETVGAAHPPGKIHAVEVDGKTCVSKPNDDSFWIRKSFFVGVLEDRFSVGTKVGNAESDIGFDGRLVASCSELVG